MAVFDEVVASSLLPSMLLILDPSRTGNFQMSCPFPQQFSDDTVDPLCSCLNQPACSCTALSYAAVLVKRHKSISMQWIPAHTGIP